MIVVRAARASSCWINISKILFLFLVCMIPAARTADTPQVIIAIGDVHGDFDDFCLILKRVGLIDEKLHWAGGQATLVQTGDLLDRGPRERQVLDLMISLEDEAAKAGGQVVSLLGNHEMMNLIGDLRYVTPDIYASFSTPDSEARRRAAYEEFVKWRKNNAQLLQVTRDPLFDVTESQWMAKHPLGSIEQREAFAPNAAYGSWVRKRPTVTKVSGILFVHGGIAPEVAAIKIEEINGLIRAETNLFEDLKQYLIAEKLILPFFTLQEITAMVKDVYVAGNKSNTPADEKRMAKLAPYLKLNTWLCIREDGPLWFRGYDEWSDAQGTPLVEKILSAYDASNIVVGHTVQKVAHIRSRFSGRVFLIDTGMVASSEHAGAASALEIHGAEKFTAVYLDGQELLLDHGTAHAVPKGQVSALFTAGGAIGSREAGWSYRK
jgi:calcineurin-like phosphoesterase family protein